MFDSGRPLMRRVLPDDPAEIVQWEHYPENDVVNGPLKCRWFYHCHPPEERGVGEHGHFHLFVDKSAMGPGVQPLVSGEPATDTLVDVVHLAGLSVSPEGMPIEWFATNRWVTDEWLYPADSIIALLPHINFAGRRGNRLVNRWLTAMVALYRDQLAAILRERDSSLLANDRTGNDPSLEILSRVPVDLVALLTSSGDHSVSLPPPSKKRAR